ncbi:phosphatase PAP2 family protein [Streptomyces sp. VRA16 Mangrove soil]|uniref:phosphatase PAP2 family protein n=1 Tax=Streptomyces sp. VRA16 Mangrove soil TaxID=2817434 RepID=UPI001A9F3037|nr:phosphatase PAP2 family protein [Streptomyces sp. VRA16 Mangrove soil]MBO1330410.1 phosphatase PAP2 family protein [Streptomyces sp. VRA16 Mangrove soil]
MTTALTTAGYFDDSLYTETSHLADHSPAVVNTLVAGWSDWGLGLFAVLMIWAWLRARAAGRPRLPALAVPLIVVVAFLANDVVKSLLQEQRPCQVLRVNLVEACPALGDWSFPSNHAAIAAAAAAALWFVDRRIALIAVPAALAMAVSRVWIGAHYPHDVAAGLLLGALVASVLAGWAVPRVTRRLGDRVTASGAPAR